MSLVKDACVSIYIAVCDIYGLLVGEGSREEKRGQARTISTVALPFSFTVSGNGASRVVPCCRRTRNAWCGRLPLPFSLIVSRSLRLSELSKVMGVSAMGDLSLNLYRQVFSIHTYSTTTIVSLWFLLLLFSRLTVGRPCPWRRRRPSWGSR